jgi:signal transduction histidine kinase/DNA-binding response OmpR family regulator
VKAIWRKFIALGHAPQDAEDEKLRKSSLLVMVGPFTVSGLAWGILYYAHGLTIPGLIPFCYGLLAIASIVTFSFKKKYVFFRNSQLFLILILPFALQTSLGGFVPGSAVIIWAVIAPAGALIFHSARKSVLWFGAYISLVVISFLINNSLPSYIQWHLDDNFIYLLFLMNIVGVSTIVFMVQYYFVRKITELKEHIESKNDELEMRSEKLRELDVVKSRFFANISHEFRTPLTLILGLAEKQGKDPDTPVSRHDTEVMRRNAKRLLQLINQLLDLSKLESGRMKLETVRGDIARFTHTLVSYFKSTADSKRIELEFNGKDILNEAELIPVDIYFDVEKLRKVLTNLMSNAMKFTPYGGKVSVTVKISGPGALEKHAEAVEIYVENSGTGIPQESLPYIFNRFYQVESGLNRQFEGTGIGLALVKELVELHHGRVQVNSENQLTIFSVILPLDSVYLSDDEKVEGVYNDFKTESFSNEILLSDVRESVPIGSRNDGMHDRPDSDVLQVLVVDDNADLRSYVKGILKDNYNVIEAVDGIDGFAKAEAVIPDLIVSDVMMPIEDGFQFCKRLKSDHRTNHIPVILLTAKAAHEDKLEGLELGADDYLVKPFNEKELLIRIKNLIAIRTQLQKKYQKEILLKSKEVIIDSACQKFLQNLKEVVEENIDNEQFGVEDLSRAIGMSRSQLHRKLKALTDQSASIFVKNYRLHRAADLLKQEVGNITEIAFQVGFNSQTYFSSSFHEHFGCSPSEFRLRYH